MDEGRGYVSLFSDGRSRATAHVIYEVWCFMPPSQRLFEALATTRAGGGQVVLVLPDEVDARIRQTVLAIPEIRRARTRPD